MLGLFFGENLKTKEAKKEALILGIRLQEAGQVNEQAREVPVLIIKEGMGNKVDRHFYSRELLQKIAPAFDGVKAYADHPSKTEESDRPERSVKDIVGYYHSPKFVEVNGRGAIEAILKINDGASCAWAWDLVKEAVAYSQKFNNKDLVGISINAYGTSHSAEMGDELVNMVDELTEVQSADIVTQAGAGGGFRLREAVKKALKEGYEGANQVHNLLKQHADGLQGMRQALKSSPEHEKAYGPAMDALIGHCAEMMSQCEKEAPMNPEAPAPAPAAAAAPAAPAPAAAAAPAAPEAKPDDKKKPMESAKPEGEEAPKPAAEAPAPAPAPEAPKPEAKKEEPAPAPAPNPNLHVEAKTPEQEFEAMQERYKGGKMSANEVKVFEALMVVVVEKAIKESGIPEAYASDLKEACAKKTTPEVKALVEARKKLVASLVGDRAEGAGAPEVKPDSGKFTEALQKAGVPLKK